MSKLVCVPMQEIMDTPGLFDALRGEDIRWTLRLRAMLAGKGLNTEDAPTVYILRFTERCDEWWFCGADSFAEAKAVFDDEARSRRNAWRKRGEEEELIDDPYRAK